LKKVPSELDKYVIDKELQHTEDFIFCVALFDLCVVLDKLCLPEETGLPTDLSQGFEYEKHHGFHSGPD